MKHFTQEYSYIVIERAPERGSLCYNFCPSASSSEFSPVSRLVQVEEPDGDTPTTLSLVVQRLGGRVGVVEVAWNVTPINTESGRFQQENTT